MESKFDERAKAPFTRRGFVTAVGAAAAVLLAGCTSSEVENGSAATAESSTDGSIEGVDSTLVPATTPQFAMVRGTWEEMGAQLAKEFPEELKCAINLSLSTAISACGDYDAVCAAYEPYVEIYDTYFTHEEDGKLSDMCAGIADELGLDYWQVATVFFPSNPEGEVASDDDSEDEETDEKSCSAAVAWGEATADGATGCISVMDADIDISDLHYMPTIVYKSDNGYTFMGMNGLFGSVANSAGFAIQSPGGSSNLDAAYGTWPHMWLAAYCATVDEAIEFMGDPEGDESTWVPMVSDYNMVLCDANGDAADYEVNSVARNVRRCGDTKVLSPAEGDVLADETSTYLLANNLYLSEPMLDNVLSNVQRDVWEYWDDVLPRYWTVDKVLSDAVADGGITLDTLSEAESETRYYIPEGWDYDYYPAWNYGRWVPSSIYETLDEDGGLTRAEYYGENYDPETWGDPYSKEESRAVEVWAAGWHEASWSATPAVSTLGYWSPTPVSDVDKNGSRDLFDSNTLTVYYMNGSSSRTVSNTVNATGTYSIVRFCADEEDDEFAAMVDSAVYDLKEQLWLAARDMEERGVDVDTADGQVIEGYLDTARTALYQGINYQAEAINQTDETERLLSLTKAICKLEEGICYAQLCQTEPQLIIKDLGDDFVDVENLVDETE